jgi:hypothetical protein
LFDFAGIGAGLTGGEPGAVAGPLCGGGLAAGVVFVTGADPFLAVGVGVTAAAGFFCGAFCGAAVGLAGAGILLVSVGTCFVVSGFTGCFLLSGLDCTLPFDGVGELTGIFEFFFIFDMQESFILYVQST